MPKISEDEIRELFYMETYLSHDAVTEMFSEDWKHHKIELSAAELIKFAHAVIEREKTK